MKKFIFLYGFFIHAILCFAADDSIAAWTTETLDSEGWAGIHTSIAMDSSDKVHISYGEVINDELKYVTNSSGFWIIETVDNEQLVGKDNSIALDSMDNVHISYSDYTPYNFGLKYATNAFGEWLSESLDNEGWRRNKSSIAIDSADKIHISYSDDTYDDLNYITNASGTWVREVVDSDGSVGSHTSIALDSSEKMHISYQEYNWGGSYGLKYATNASGSWVTETIDTGLWVGEYTSIAIDSEDKVHIIYHDDANGLLKYATNASGSWVIETVDSDGFAGRDNSMALDSADMLHVSYSALVDYDSQLRYATNASGEWVIETVDSDGYTGVYTSIALDSSDMVHISYCDYDNKDLKYATNVPYVGYTLTVSREGTGTGTVSSYPAGINCGADCSQEYNQDSGVILSAVPDASSTFAGWSGGGCSGTGTCQVTMNADKTVTALFAIKTYTITAAAGPNGSITPAGAMQATYGSDHTFSITPDAGYQVLDVVVDGVPAGAVSGYTFTNVTVDHSITASFTPDTALILRTYREGTGTGTVTGNPSVIDCGSDCAEGYDSVIEITLTATPDISSTFAGWSGGGCSGTGTCQVTMSADTTVTAMFEIKTFTITATAGPNGSITPAGAVQTTYGSDQTFTITPDAGYYIEDVLADGISQGAVMDYTFNTITAAHTIEASFTSPVLQVNPSFMTEAITEGETSSQILTLSNTGGVTLTYSVAVRETSDPLNTQGAPGQSSVRTSFITSIPEGAEYVPGEIIVRYASGTFRSSALALSSIRSNGGATVKGSIPKLNMEIWTLSTQSSTGLSGSAASAATSSNDEQALLDAIAALSENPDIAYAEPNYIYRVNGTPDDPRFDELWGLHNTGQTGGTVDADIDAPEAWDFFTGDNSVVVAVIDTGVDYNHEDLASNMWINEDEIPGNGIDDDANGYIDDEYGYDFAYNDADPIDGHFHGTHCAGTVGAAGGNSTGVAGVSHSVRIMAVKFLSDSGNGSTTDAIDAVLYAVDNGADILSNSWGGGAYSLALQDAIAYANNNDVLFVAAAGNDYSNNDLVPQYPAGYGVPNVIAVAATDHNDNKPAFSNYGADSVDLGAPGAGILSTTPYNNYASHNGTSMAAPHVSGAAALLKGYNPLLSVSDIKSIIMNSVDPIAALQGKTVTGGRLNVKSALLLAGPAWVRATGQFSGEIEPGSSVDVTIHFDSAGKAVGEYTADITINSDDPVNPVQTILTTLTISDASPTADFTGSPTIGAAPLIVDFTNNSTGHDQPLTYAWDFDSNGITDSVLADPSYTYTQTGLYSVTLSTTDSDGTVNVLSKTSYVTVSVDSDGDGILADGNGNGTEGDTPCTGGNTSDCDDNCTGVYNPDQADSDGDGIGNMCDLDFGLVAYYPFEGNAHDKSGYNNHGTINGPILIADRFGRSSNAYDFDGLDDLITLPAASHMGFNNNEYSVVFWIKTSDDSGYILDERSTLDELGYMFEIYQDWNEVTYTANGVIIKGGRNGFGDVLDGQWHMLVAVVGDCYYDPTYLWGYTLYSDTELIGEGCSGVQNIGESNPIYIGGQSTTPNSLEHYDGIIDDIRIYNRILSESEIELLFSDHDRDGIPDGDGTNPCTGGNTADCDDNCPNTQNPDQADADNDGTGNLCDNCREVYNPDQRDSNYYLDGVEQDDNTALPGMQHYGDICDPDYDNDGLVKLSDFSVWRMWFRNTVPPAPEYVDHDGDGLIKLSDFSIWRKYFRGAPGPGIGD